MESNILHGESELNKIDAVMATVNSIFFIMLNTSFGVTIMGLSKVSRLFIRSSDDRPVSAISWSSKSKTFTVQLSLLPWNKYAVARFWRESRIVQKARLNALS